MTNDSNNNVRHAVVNGQSGVWVPVQTGKVPETVSTDPTKPSVGTDNNLYYADPFVTPGQQPGAPYSALPYANNNAYSQQYGAPQPIAANMNNAIPTPSSIVQLPPIVQPISLVPFASQNQPLVQYDPNVRPDIPDTKTPEPVYRRKPYVGLSILVLVLAVFALMLGCLIPIGKTALIHITDLIEKEQVTKLIAGDMSQLWPVVVGGLTVLAFIFILVVFIDALVKICMQKAVAKFHVCNLLALLCLIAAILISIVLCKASFVDGISFFIMAVLVLVIMLVSAFVKRDAIEIDYVASKQTFIMK